MKLLLTSADLANEEIITTLEEMTGKPCKDNNDPIILGTDYIIAEHGKVQ